MNGVVVNQAGMQRLAAVAQASQLHFGNGIGPYNYTGISRGGLPLL